MDSPLSYINSEGFRKELMVKNLKPYAKSPKQPVFPITYEYKMSFLAVTDSPDNILDQALPESIKWKSINKYGNGSQSVIDSAPFFESIDQPTDGTAPRGFNNQPYPSTFVPSSYSPLSILLNVDPQGSSGLLSQDSFIVRLGAQKLREEFEARIARQIEKQTIGRANFLNVDGVSDIVNILNGKVPLIEPNYTITVPENPILAANDFILRLGGSILPVSTIPGSYWDTNTSLRQPSTIGQLQNAFRNSFLGNFVSNLLGTNQTGSQIFYNNTGAGQKSRLFYNIDFNRYKPSYDRTLFNRLAGALVGSRTDNSDFYIGSNTSDPSRILSPSRELPINSYGQELQVPVYGPSEIAKQFDGASQSIKIGANGPSYSDGGGIEGGFTWVSPKYKGNAGKKVGIGGEITNQDENFSPSSYSSTESTNSEFRDNSILDQTQRIIDSQPNGARRLQHVGNAIDQVSKVFNDGYKEITKGSKVLSYVGSIGQEVGTEYCRIFTKDTPYLQYNDLQKTDGMTTEGRKFAYSVLDKTYNLNIVPNKLEGGKSSTNLITGEGNNLGYAKKYMFSLENLAWRTSSTPGYTVADLPMCERGPNGGRVMWFPPYNLTFDESSQANWKNTDFIGRPEPVFTYTNTSRGGSLSWDIVVDHPSVLNIIVNKVLADQTNKVRINSIIDSFFAGCRKYDLYELAKKYYKINRSDLYELQKLITDKKVTDEQINFIKQTIQTGNNSPTNNDTPVAPTQDTTDWSKYSGFAFYFENDKPAKGLVPNYQLEYNLYINNKSIYEKESDNATQTNEFFERVVTPNFSVMNKLITDLEQKLKQFPQGNITINLEATCSAPASIAYNDVLADRRMVSAVKYFEENISLKDFIGNKRLILMTGSTPGEATVSSGVATSTVSTPKAYNGNGNNNDVANFEDKGRVLCSDQGTGVQGGDTTVVARGVYNVRAMSCRRVSITKITSTLKENTPEPQPIKPNTVDVLVENKIITSKTVPVTEETEVLRDNITKRVLRSLLSECDYFEVIKETTPMVYDNLRDKLKFFQPAFHSMTPEGLNSRLTFLQQCVRPGDTIPTVVERDGEVTRQYNNATNTAFGAPPVLILRIGDFFNTKIIPRNLQLKYEQLDLNPEGIGVQPMIAKVSLSFDFIGGSGLKNSVDRLQNALSFNYYANTEMWDDRADVTDDSYKILDKEFLEAILTPQPPSPAQATQPPSKDNNNTIGTILTKVFGDFQTGTTTYSDFMVTAKDQTQNYFNTVVNKMKESLEQYNNAVRQQWVLERNYTVGDFQVAQPNKTKLFGKPKNIQKRFDEISKKFIEDIDDNLDPFIQFISLEDRDFNPKLIRQIKQNYKRYVTNKTQTFQNAIFKIVQDVTAQEQSYLHTIGQLNTITYGDTNRGTDGYQEKNGKVVVFNISGTTGINPSSKNVTDTLDELIKDVQKIETDLKLFEEELGKSHPFTYTGNKISYSGILVNKVSDNGLQLGDELTTNQVFLPFSKKNKYISSTLTLTLENNFSFRRQYMYVSDDIMDDKKYQTFKDSILSNVLDNQVLLGKKNRTNVSEVFDYYWKECAKPIFMEENDITKEFIDSMEKNVLNSFLNYTPFDKKERVFTYTSQGVGNNDIKSRQELLIKGLGLSSNYKNDLNTWNDEFVSKVKLN